MKKTLLRNNIRKLHANPIQNKSIHSQSPNHKKLLKKIELTQRDAPQYQYEMSLQDNLVFQKPQEEVVDFRVEIERRFQKSFANHTFVFPRRKLDHNEEMLEESGSSNNSSFESLRHVTVYELVSQNKKRQKQHKPIYKTHDEYVVNGKESSSMLSKDHRIRTEPDQGMDSDDSRGELSGVPIEIRIQDKNSNTYKKLISLLEKQLNKNNAMITESRPLYVPKSEDSRVAEDKAKNYRAQQQQQQQQQQQHQVPAKEIKKDTKEKRPSTNPHARKNMLLKDESQRSLGYLVNRVRTGEGDSKLTEKSEAGISFQESIDKLRKSTKTLEMSQRLKKVQSKEKVTSLLDASNGESLVSLDSRLSPNGKKAIADMSRLSQDNKKKIYTTNSSSSLLRALTPKCIATKNISNIKDKSTKIEKQPNQAESLLMSQTPSSTLYQKAQDDVLNGKLRMTTQKSQKKGLNSTSDSSKLDKAEVYQALDIKGVNFIDFYGSPKVQQQKTSQVSNHTMYNNFAKARNSRKTDGRTGEKSSERHAGYVSYELSSSKNSNSKPTFKLDLSTRVPKHRDMLSSTRTRDNLSKEKSSDMLSIDSILKGSYDMQNHSLIRNASKQSDIGKRKVGVTPKGNMAKNHI